MPSTFTTTTVQILVVAKGGGRDVSEVSELLGREVEPIAPAVTKALDRLIGQYSWHRLPPNHLIGW